MKDEFDLQVKTKKREKRELQREKTLLSQKEAKKRLKVKNSLLKLASKHVRREKRRLKETKHRAEIRKLKDDLKKMQGSNIWPKIEKVKVVKETSDEDLNKRLIASFKITLEDKLTMYKAQNECCAICGDKKHYKGAKGLAIDHNHITGKIRGLLCSHCNTSIGLLKENPNTILSMYRYIMKHNFDTVV